MRRVVGIGLGSLGAPLMGSVAGVLGKRVDVLVYDSLTKSASQHAAKYNTTVRLDS